MKSKNIEKKILEEISLHQSEYFLYEEKYIALLAFTTSC